MTSWAALATALLILLSSFGNLSLPAVAIGDENPAIVQDSDASDLDQEQKSDDSDDDKEDTDDQDQNEEDKKDGETLSDTSNGDNAAGGSGDVGDEEQNKDTVTDPSDDRDSDEEKTKTDRNEDGDSQQKDADNEQEEKDPTANDLDEDGTVTDPDQEDENANIGLTDPDAVEKPSDELAEKDEKENTEGQGAKALTAEAGDAVITATAASDDSYFPAGAALEVTASREDDLRWTYALHFVDENGDDLALAGAVNVKLTWDEPAAPESLDPDYTYEVKAYQDERETGIRTDSDYRVASVSLETDQDTTVSVVWTKQDRKVPEKKAENHRLSAENDDFKVVVTSKEEEFPEDAELVLTEYTKDNDDHADDYQKAKAAVLEAKKDANSDFDEDTLGLRVLDISIENNGSEWEPDGAVKVSLEMKTLPDGVENGDSLQIQHITEKDESRTDSDSSESSSSDTGNSEDSDSESRGGILSKLNSFRALRKAAKAIVQSVVDKAEMKATTVADAVEAIGGKAKADFTVDGFSVFTITWTKSSSDSTRVGSVNVHYVNNTGADMANPTSIPTSSLVAGSDDDNTVTLASWGNDNSNKTRLTGYTYQEAHLETYNGTKITKLRVNSGTTEGTYVLQYQAAGSEEWITYRDSVSGQNENNVEVYLIFTQNPYITVHHVDSAWNEIADSETKYAEDLTSDSGVSVDSWKKTITDYTYQASNGARLGSTTGEALTAVKATQTNGSYTLQYKNGNSATWSDMDATDVYLIYDKNSYTKKITIHYTDLAGIAINDEAGRPLTQTVDAADWTSGTAVDFVSEYANVYTPDGYAPFNAGNTDRTRLNTDDLVANQIVLASANKATTDTMNDYKRSFEGKRFRYMTYTAADTESETEASLTYGTTSTTSLAATGKDNNIDVYIMYSKNLIFHDVDQYGNELGPTRTQSYTYSTGSSTGTAETLYLGSGWYSDTENSAYNGSNDLTKNTASNASTYGTRTEVYVKTNGTKTSVASGNSLGLYWRYVNSQWKTNIVQSSTSKEVEGLITDIYYVYPQGHTVTIHYVDTDGKKIKETTTETLTANKTYTPASDNDSYAIKNYTLSSGKYGVTADSDGNISGNTETTFYSFQFSKDARTNKWSNSSKSTANDTTYSAVDTLQDDIWLVYTKTDSDNAAIYIHYVDEEGNYINLGSDKTNPQPVTGAGQIDSRSYSSWNGKDLTANSLTGVQASSAAAVAAGYTFVGGYLGPEFNMDSNKLVNDSTKDDNTFVQWLYKSGNDTGKKWYTSHGTSATAAHNDSDSDLFNDYITDIYWVYRKNSNTDLTLNYVYFEDADTYGDRTVNSITASDVTNLSGFSNPSSISGSSLGTTASGATRIDDVNSDGTASTTVPATITVGSGDDAKTYEYVGTRIGPALSSSLKSSDLGPYVQRVYNNNGELMYYGESTVPLTFQKRNTYSYEGDDGRRFVLTRSGSEGSYNYSLTDSRHGTVILSQSSAGKYTASFHGEAQTTEYTVTEGAASSYQLKVADWLPETQTNVYEIYTDTSVKKLTIEDDIKYSGYLKAVLASDVPSGGTYSWFKTVNNGDAAEVTRKQTGIHYNVEYDPKERTWLDLEADEGGLSSTQTSVSYYVTYTYTDSSGVAHTLQSDPLDIHYYSELMNGSFETPAYSNPVNQINNTPYKESGGVWQSTGTGQESGGPANVSIEIVNTTIDSNNDNTPDFISSYAWNTNSDIRYKSDGTTRQYAADGDQFAELNCSVAGALYQDVVTHPNEELHYWFSHRARGNPQVDRSTPEYDTMYLVIMPTKLAMTSASDGGELKTQSDLIDFISEHGGYSYNLADSEEEEVTYQDFDNGILVLKVSSSDQAWHAVNKINGYVAKSGLTRFFFAAGPTSWTGTSGGGSIESGSRDAVLRATHGNFIDAVGFSQSYPKTDGFNLSVTKTFSGLNEGQIASMAANASTVTLPNEITKATNPFEITISDKYYSSNGTVDSNLANAALNGAKLGFTVSGSSGSYTFTPTATQNGTNLITGNNTVDAKWNDDDSLTLTWTFLDQSLVNQQGDSGNDERYYYTVTENHAGYTNYYLLSEETYTNQHNSDTDKTTTRGTGNSVYIREKDSATFTLSNTYSQSNASEQPQLLITKTFTGMTPAAVDALLPSYTLKVQKGSTATDTVTLVGDEQNPVAYSEDFNADDTLTVTLEKSTSEDVTTLTWLVRGWGSDNNYTITEEEYETTTNPLLKATVTVSGTSNNLTETSRNATVNSQNVTIKGMKKESLSIGTASTLQYDSNTDATETATSGSSLETPTTQPKENANLIIAQYTQNSTTRYVVWTEKALGTNTTQAILSKIKTLWSSDTVATDDNTEFHSGTNPGTISAGMGGAGSMNYDSSKHALSFTTTTGLTWNKYYSTRYWVDSGDTDSGIYTETDIAVANNYKPAVRVLKKDSEDDSLVLSGAEFRLFTYNQAEGEGSAAKKYFSWNGTTASWKTTENDATKLTTNGQGYAVGTSGANSLVIIGNLTEGIYYLEETKAPSGYSASSKNVYAFKVNSTGAIRSASDSEINEDEKSKIGTASIDWNSPYYTITITNTPTNVQIRKVSSKSTSINLEGAEFKLFRVKEVTAGEGASQTTSTVNQYYKDIEAGVEQWTTVKDEGKTFTTNSSGIAELPDLYAGTYYLEEVGAPTGFNMLSKPVGFTVTGSGTVEIPAADNEGKVGGVEVANSTTKNGNDSSVAKLESSTDNSTSLTTYSIVIKDGPAYVLPSTGGRGTRLFHVLGLALILLVAVMAVVTVRKV